MPSSVNFFSVTLSVFDKFATLWPIIHSTPDCLAPSNKRCVIIPSKIRYFIPLCVDSLSTSSLIATLNNWSLLESSHTAYNVSFRSLYILPVISANGLSSSLTCFGSVDCVFRVSVIDFRISATRCGVSSSTSTPSSARSS